MNKKMFIVTIPKRLREGMNDIRYVVHGAEEYITEPGIFPSVSLIEKAAADASLIKVAAIITEDDSGSSERNLSEFRQTIALISERTGTAIELVCVIRAMNDEVRAKQMNLFRDICSVYEEGTEIYVDVTYGTKITSLVLMSTLSYAEKIRNCEIKSIIYGNAFGKSETDNLGDIYDVRCLYELFMLMGCLDDMPKDMAEKMISGLLE